MFTFPVCHFSGVDGPDLLSSIAGLSVSAELDATLLASYGGSGQTWANVITSPSDGAAQTAYDFHLGADSGSSTDDPTFTNNAGADDAFWDMDGGDFFLIKNIANTIALKNAHRTDQATGFWAAMAYNQASDTGVSVWGNGDSVDDRTVRFFNPAATDVVRLTQANGTNIVQFNTSSSTSPYATDRLIIISWDGSETTNNIKVWNNSASVSDTINGTFLTDTTISTTEYLIGGGSVGGGAHLPNGSKIYSWAFGNEFFSDDAKPAAIRDLWQTRHAGTRY